jgi:hypothetical protein
MVTAQISEAEYQNLRRTVLALEQRMMSVEGRLADAPQEAASPAIDGWREEIARITSELFPGEVTIKVTRDPEYPQDALTVVHAQACGAIQEIEDRRIQWHQRMRDLSPSLRLLPLRITYRP